jgi:hypothetical protein
MALEIDYTPPPTGEKFMESDAKMRALMGPVGSGKSVTCSFEVIRRASMQQPDPNTGKRRTRAAVVRETARQLQDTTIKTFLDWFPPGVCGRYMRTTKTYFFEVGDVECEIMFRALDDSDDVANLNSLELTFAWFNECRDIAPEIVDAMSKRVGRFPSSKDGGPTWHGMWGDTNPPTMDTWWYYQMERHRPQGRRVAQQQRLGRIQTTLRAEARTLRTLRTYRMGTTTHKVAVKSTSGFSSTESTDCPVQVCLCTDTSVLITTWRERLFEALLTVCAP